MRFADIRRTVFKRTEFGEVRGDVATPQRLSPFKTDGHTVRKELHKDDVEWPTYNRERRRASGQVKPRRRLRGSIPPHPISVINAAHRIEYGVELEKRRQRATVAKSLGIHINQVDEAKVIEFNASLA